MKFDGMLEYQILEHWREYEPERVKALLTDGILEEALRTKADALFQMQLDLERNERLDPALAELEAWRSLMRREIGEDEVDGDPAPRQCSFVVISGNYRLPKSTRQKKKICGF